MTEKMQPDWQELTIQQEQKMSAAVAADSNRLKLHLMPPVGWLNDPNGLCQFRGKYHVFYQYSPLDARGGMKAWGHYTSQDLIHWSQEKAPLFPDAPFDMDGVYSGSALIDENRMYLYYTGNVKVDGDYDYTLEGREANTVLVESVDGIQFSSKQLIMTNGDYPADYTCHIRDPKVWKEDNRYYMVQGGRKRGTRPGDEDSDQGTILVFAGRDVRHFHCIQEISTRERFGYMWECPDYFKLQDVFVLGCCPQGVASEKYQYQNVYQAGYYLLSEDIVKHTVEECDGAWDMTCLPENATYTEWDMGFDFYAPQTFLDEQGRRILIGWAGIPDADYDNQPTVDKGWQHALTIPRELTMEEGRLLQKPIAELGKLRHENYMPAHDIPVEVPGNVFELLIRNRRNQECSIVLGDSEQMEETVAIRYENQELRLELSHAAGRGRMIRRLLLEELRNLQIYVDTSMIEIFVNDGEAVFTSRYYFSNEKRTLCIQDCDDSILWTLNGLDIVREGR